MDFNQIHGLNPPGFVVESVRDTRADCGSRDRLAVGLRARADSALDNGGQNDTRGLASPEPRRRPYRLPEYRTSWPERARLECGGPQPALGGNGGCDRRHRYECPLARFATAAAGRTRE